MPKRTYQVSWLYTVEVEADSPLTDHEATEAARKMSLAWEEAGTSLSISEIVEQDALSVSELDEDGELVL